MANSVIAAQNGDYTMAALNGVAAAGNVAGLALTAVGAGQLVGSVRNLGTVTVVHFTDQAGVNAIQAAGTLRAGTFVTLPSEVAGRGAAQVATALEIQAGRGAF
ncbi:MAG: hypothetical protein ACREH8_20815, partial [Opitutaceae bacterium]